MSSNQAPASFTLQQADIERSLVKLREPSAFLLEWCKEAYYALEDAKKRGYDQAAAAMILTHVETLKDLLARALRSIDDDLGVLTVLSPSLCDAAGYYNTKKHFLIEEFLVTLQKYIVPKVREAFGRKDQRMLQVALYGTKAGTTKFQEFGLETKGMFIDFDGNQRTVPYNLASVKNGIKRPADANGGKAWDLLLEQYELLSEIWASIWEVREKLMEICRAWEKAVYNGGKPRRDWNNIVKPIQGV